METPNAAVPRFHSAAHSESGSLSATAILSVKPVMKDLFKVTSLDNLYSVIRNPMERCNFKEIVLMPIFMFFHFGRPERRVGPSHCCNRYILFNSVFAV